ncbi:MAG: FtsX-like permease family protein, partial [Terriglobales bacterium]
FPVLGVMPPGFDFPGHTRIWMLQPKGVGLSMFAPTIARLQPGLSLPAATVRLRTILRPQGFTGGRVWLEPFHDYLLGNRRPLLWMLWAVALLFLLLACAGVANLILARGVRRQPEAALRLALGAGRARLIGQLLTEALLLACGGGILALGLAAAAGGALRNTLQRTLGPTAVAPHSALTASAGLVILLAVAAAVVCGLLPAWRVVRTDAGALLKPAGPGSSLAQPRSIAVRELFTGGQLALALALLIASGLLIRSVEARLNVNFGFDARHIVAIQAQLPRPPALVKAWRVFDRLRRANHNISANAALQTKAMKKSGLASAAAAEEQRDDRAFAAAQADLSRVPGVLAAGELAPLPFNGIGSRPFGTIWLEPGDSSPYISAYTRSAGGDFIRALGIRLLAGRTFTPAETAAAAEVEEAATRTWGSPRQ